MSKYNFSESEFREMFISYMKTTNYQLHCEVPVFSRSVDLVMYDDRKNAITAIEFKLKDWQRAIEQIENIKICFDYTMLCMPMPSTENARLRIISACTQNGIGIFFYDVCTNEFSSALDPNIVENNWDIQKSSIVNYLKGSRDGCIEASPI